MKQFKADVDCGKTREIFWPSANILCSRLFWRKHGLT